jgi:hypothetical protein
LGASGFGALAGSELGAAALGASGFGALAGSELGAAALGASGFEALAGSELEPSALGASALGASDFESLPGSFRETLGFDCSAGSVLGDVELSGPAVKPTLSVGGDPLMETSNKPHPSWPQGAWKITGKITWLSHLKNLQKI